MAMKLFDAADLPITRALRVTRAGLWTTYTVANKAAVGPTGEKIFTRVTTAGPAMAKKVLVVMAGVHGAEDFAGTRVQAHLMQELPNRVPSSIKVVLISHVCSSGVAWGQRTTWRAEKNPAQANVDLNRNCVMGPRVTTCGHHEIVHVVAPESWVPGKSEALLGEGIGRLISKHGPRGFQQKLTGGQYDYPNSLFYGGEELVREVEILRDIVERELGHATEVEVLDLHTGLGAYATSELFSVRTTKDEKLTAYYGLPVSFPLISEGGSVSSMVQGDLMTMMASWLPKANFNGLALEFGTVPVQHSAPLMIALNAAVAHGLDKHPQHADYVEQLRAQVLECFWPRDDISWQETFDSDALKVALRMVLDLNSRR